MCVGPYISSIAAWRLKDVFLKMLDQINFPTKRMGRWDQTTNSELWWNVACKRFKNLWPLFFFFLIFVQKYKQIAHFEEMPLIFFWGGVLVQVYIIQTQQCWAVVNLLTWPLEGHSLPCWLLSCSWLLVFQPIRRSQMIRFIFHSWFSLPKKKKVKKNAFWPTFWKASLTG